jgi:hypothetical protein
VVVDLLQCPDESIASFLKFGKKKQVSNERESFQKKKHDTSRGEVQTKDDNSFLLTEHTYIKTIDVPCVIFIITSSKEPDSSIH